MKPGMTWKSRPWGCACPRGLQGSGDHGLQGPEFQLFLDCVALNKFHLSESEFASWGMTSLPKLMVGSAPV